MTSGLKSNFICHNIPTKAILFFFGCSEVNSTWLITSELANQRARKVLFTCVVYTLLISIFPLLDVIVLTMKTKLTIPILQRALRSKIIQIERKRSQTLLFLGHHSLIKNKKQTAVINILNLRIFCLRLDVAYVTVHIFSNVTIEI